MDNNDKGNKHICTNCGTKFYDLNKKEVICPKCGTKKFEKNLEKGLRVLKKEEVKVQDIIDENLEDDINFDDDDDLDDGKDSTIIDVE